MKKIFAIVLVLTMVFALAACGADEPAVPEVPAATDTPAAPETPAVPEEQEPTGDRTMGEVLMGEFLNQVSAGVTDPQQIAETLLSNEVIEFAGAAVPVEPGYLAGFSAEIHGFEQGVMFAPMIGSIPFVGYIFTVEGDAEEFNSTLLENADPRWNICVEAAETVSTTADDLVFFVMCP